MTVSQLLIGYETTDEDLRAFSDEFESASPEVILEWADEEFGTDVALATGFGAEGCVLVSMLADIDVRTRVFYLDTDLLFPETYALRDQLEARYGVHFERRATSLDVPYNPLHDRGYPSLGCVPCTTPVQIGEDSRAGRWRGTSKTECGIHQVKLDGGIGPV